MKTYCGGGRGVDATMGRKERRVVARIVRGRTQIYQMANSLLK